MSEVDLIPAEFHRRHQFSGWLKTAGGVLLLLSVALVAAFFTVRSLNVDLEREIRQLQSQKAITTSHRKELERLDRQRRSLGQQLELLSGLRSGAAAEQMILAIEQAIPSADLWLTDWKFRRAGTPVDITDNSVNTGYFIVIPRGEDARPNEPEEAWKIETRMTLRGQAMDHAALSEFVLNLTQVGLIGKVRVVNTQLTEINRLKLVNFSLEIVITNRPNPALDAAPLKVVDQLPGGGATPAGEIADTSPVAGGGWQVEEPEAVPYIDPGLLAHWTMDETSGEVVRDLAGNHDARLINPPQREPGHQGGGLGFDGVDDRVVSPARDVFDNLFASGATVSAWIYPRGWGGGDYGRILDKADAVRRNRNGWALEVDGARQALLFEQGFSDNVGQWNTPDGSIQLEQWQHVALVYDSRSDANDPQVYINGVAQPLTEVDPPTGAATDDRQIRLTLGNFAQDDSRAFDGVLDEVRIYNRPLARDRVARLAAARLAQNQVE